MSERTKIFEELFDMISVSTDYVKICTPSSDYYRRADEWSEEKIRFINADVLLQLLQDAIYESKANDVAATSGNFS